MQKKQSGYHKASIICSVILQSTLANANIISYIPEFSASGTNKFQEQSYLDNYKTDYGDGKISRFDFSNALQILGTSNTGFFIELRNSHIPKIKTHISGANLAYRFSSQNGIFNTLSLGADYTKYDMFHFKQTVASYVFSYENLDIITNLYYPFGQEQSYSPEEYISPSSLVAMKGIDFKTQQSLKAINTELSALLSYFWHQETKDNIKGVTATAAYYMKPYLSMGASYQFREGIESKYYGFSIFSKISLSKLENKTTSINRSLAYQPYERQVGSTIQAKEATDCIAGTESYSAHGSTICDTSNPFDGAQLLKEKKKIRDGVTLGSIYDRALIKEGSFTFNPKRLYVIDNVLSYKSFNIPSGTTIVMTAKGGLVSREGGSKIGDDTVNDNTDFVNIVTLGSYKKAIDTSDSKSIAAIDRLLKGQASNDETVERGSKDDTSPRVGIVIAGQGQLNMASPSIPTDISENLTATELLIDQTVENIPETVTEESSKTVTLKKSIDVARNGIFGETILGGNTKDANTISSIKKVVMYGVPLTVIADDVQIEQLSARVTNSYGATFLGGRQWITNSQIVGTEKTMTGLGAAFGSESNINATFFNMSAATIERNRAIRQYHGGLGSDGDTTGATRMFVSDSNFQSTTSVIEPLISVVNGKKSGGQFFSINNVFNLYGVLTDENNNVLDGSAGVFDIPITDRLLRSNSETPAQLQEATVLMGNTIVSDATPYDENISQTRENVSESTARLVGLGNIFKSPDNTDGEYGNGQAGSNGNSANCDVGSGGGSAPDLGQYVTAITLPDTSTLGLGAHGNIQDTNGLLKIRGWTYEYLGANIEEIVVFRNRNTESSNLTLLNPGGSFGNRNIITDIDNSIKPPIAAISEVKLPDGIVITAARTNSPHTSAIGSGTNSQSYKMLIYANPTGSKSEFNEYLKFKASTGKYRNEFASYKSYSRGKNLIANTENS